MRNDLSDNQRRFICRLVFLLVCALPTIAVVYFAAHQRTADQWAQLIQAELGVETTIGGVESPRPGEFVFRDVKLYDKDGQEFFASLTATASLGHRNKINFPTHVAVMREGMSHFLEDAAHRIIKPDADAGLWTVNFNNVEIIGKQDFGLASLELHRTEIRLHDSSSHGPYVRLETLLEGKSGVRSEDWGWLQLSKNPSTDELHVEFDTTELGAVPCWMASHWFPSLKMLGSKAQFTGHSLIKSHGRASNCFASATGEFIDIALPAIPGLPPADADAAKSLRVSDVRFENLLWSDGKAEICRDGNRYFEIPNQKYYVPDTRPNEIFTDAVRAAFRRNSNVGLRR